MSKYTRRYVGTDEYYTLFLKALEGQLKGTDENWLVIHRDGQQECLIADFIQFNKNCRLPNDFAFWSAVVLNCHKYDEWDILQLKKKEPVNDFIFNRDAFKLSIARLALVHDCELLLEQLPEDLFLWDFPRFCCNMFWYNSCKDKISTKGKNIEYATAHSAIDLALSFYYFEF